MYERVLVAVDGSAASNAALVRAIKLATDHQAELRVVNVVDATAVPWDDDGLARPDRIWDQLLHASDKTLTNAMAAIAGAGYTAERVQGVREKARQKTGDVILGEAEAWHADLIVIGSRGRGPIRRALLGSVDTTVARSASMPVLSVRVSPTVTPGQRAARAIHSATPGHVGMA